MGTSRDDLLVTPAQLDDLRASGRHVVVLDVRWTLGGPPGREAYLQGHVPGAVHVDLDTELASHGEPTDGRHPLPSVTDLEAAARRWGVRTDSAVVVLDGGGNLAAARAWWLLRWGGHADVRLLDGALPAWTASGRPLETGEVVPEPGDVVLDGGHLPVVEADDVLALARRGTLLDARAAERFRGEMEPVDPVAGHVPGARSAPATANLDVDGRFLGDDELRERFLAAGLDPTAPVAAYCGSGVTAAHAVVALALAGVEAALYPGSWSQWSQQGRAVATGA